MYRSSDNGRLEALQRVGHKTPFFVTAAVLAVSGGVSQMAHGRTTAGAAVPTADVRLAPITSGGTQIWIEARA